LEAFGHILDDGSYVHRLDHVMYQICQIVSTWVSDIQHISHYRLIW